MTDNLSGGDYRQQKRGKVNKREINRKKKRKTNGTQIKRKEKDHRISSSNPITILSTEKIVSINVDI